MRKWLIAFLLFIALPTFAQVIIGVARPPEVEQSSPTGWQDYNSTDRSGSPGAFEVQP